MLTVGIVLATLAAPVQAQGLTDAERALLLYLYRSQQAPPLNPGLEAARRLLEEQRRQQEEAQRLPRIYQPPPPVPYQPLPLPPSYVCRPGLFREGVVCNPQ